MIGFEKFGQEVTLYFVGRLIAIECTLPTTIRNISNYS
jgi:hypothetical protein